MSAKQNLFLCLSKSVQTKFAKHTLYLILSGECFWAILNVSFNMGDWGVFGAFTFTSGTWGWALRWFSRNVKEPRWRQISALMISMEKANPLLHRCNFLFISARWSSGWKRLIFLHRCHFQFKSGVQVWLSTPSRKHICKLLWGQLWTMSPQKSSMLFKGFSEGSQGFLRYIWIYQVDSTYYHTFYSKNIAMESFVQNWIYFWRVAAKRKQTISNIQLMQL